MLNRFIVIGGPYFDPGPELQQNLQDQVGLNLYGSPNTGPCSLVIIYSGVNATSLIMFTRGSYSTYTFHPTYTLN